MGKGKRNRALEYEAVAKKRKNAANGPSTLLIAIICIVIALAVVAALAFTMLSGRGIAERHRIVIESSTGDFDINQEMAAFLAWQNIWQTAYYEYYYYSWGIYTDTYKVLENYSSAEEYALTCAMYSTNADNLRSTLENDSMKNYLCQLVAGADAAKNAKYKLTDAEKQEAKDILTWVENVKNAFASISDLSLDAFLKTYIHPGMNKSDVRDAAEVLAMSTKFTSATTYEAWDDFNDDAINDYVKKNPQDFFSTKGRAIDVTAYGADFIGKKLNDDGKTSLSEEELRTLLAELVLDENTASFVNSYYNMPDANEGLIKLAGADESTLPGILSDLGITAKTFTADEDLNDGISEWILSGDRKAGDQSVIETEKGFYLVYIFEDATGTTGNYSVKAGFKFYSGTSESVRESANKDLTAIGELSGTDLTDKLTSLGITGKVYTSANQTDDKLTTWLFNTSRKANENNRVSSAKNGVYLVHVYSVTTAGEGENLTVSSIEAGMKQYNYDYSSLLASWKTDLLAGKNSTANKTALDKANEITELDKDASSIKLTAAGSLSELVEAGFGDTASEKITNEYFGADADAKAGDLFRVEDGVLAYVIRLNSIDTAEDGSKTASISYTSVQGDPYCSVLQSMIDMLASYYSEEPATFTYNSNILFTAADDKGTPNVTGGEQWLFEPETVNDLTNFVRKAGDIKLFTTTSSTGVTSYSFYYSSEAPKEDKDESSAVNGGYLHFNTKEEADKALSSLSGLSGFDLWNAISFMDGTGKSTSKDADGKEVTKDTTTSPMIETGITETSIADDAALKAWLFDSSRKKDDVAVVEAADGGYYLTYFYSAATTWKATVIDTLASDKVNQALQDQINNAKYDFKEGVLDKIGKAAATTAKTAA